MDESKARLINDLLMPWDELSSALAFPHVVQPGLSKLGRDVGALIISFAHFPELLWGADRREVAHRHCPHYQLLVDAADTVKHGELKNPLRICRVNIRSRFEYLDGQGYRFLRNRAVLAHPKLGELDALLACRDAARYWIREVAPDLQWTGAVHLGPVLYRPIASLAFPVGMQPVLRSCRVELVSPNSTGGWAPVDLGAVGIEVADRDYTQGLNREIGPE